MRPCRDRCVAVQAIPGLDGYATVRKIRIFCRISALCWKRIRPISKPRIVQVISERAPYLILEVFRVTLGIIGVAVRINYNTREIVRAAVRD